MVKVKMPVCNTPSSWSESAGWSESVTPERVIAPAEPIAAAAPVTESRTAATVCSRSTPEQTSEGEELHPLAITLAARSD